MYRIADNLPTSPVTLNEAKAHLRVSHTEEDSLISSLLLSAAQYCEQYQRRFYSEREITVHVDDFVSPWLIPFAPVQSIDAVTIDGTAATFELRPSGWLETDADGGDAVITATVGYAATADVPYTVKAAILLLVGHWYHHREAAGETMVELPIGAKALLDMERVYS